MIISHRVCKYHKTRLNKLSHEKNKKLDYVLVKEKMKYTVREKVLKSPVVSDHLTIITNIKI